MVVAEISPTNQTSIDFVLIIQLFHYSTVSCRNIVFHNKLAENGILKDFSEGSRVNSLYNNDRIITQ